MYAQKSDYAPPPRFDIDHRTAVMIAYQNCLNSFAFSEMTAFQQMDPVAGPRSASISHVTLTRFIYNFALLDGLIEADKDDDFKKAGPPNSIHELMKKYGRVMSPVGYEVTSVPGDQLFIYWGRVDKFLREKNLYAIDKIQKGHL